MCEEFIRQEYFELLAQVKAFDAQFLIVKGWAVTFSLAMLALGFQKKLSGLFLIAAVSALSFWMLEGTMKQHQMQHYPRMRAIEVMCYPEIGGPAIDWSWEHSKELLNGKVSKIQSQPEPRGELQGYNGAYFLWHVMLPHIFTIILGAMCGLYYWRHELSQPKDKKDDKSTMLAT